jgi:hypothetical protein
MSEESAKPASRRRRRGSLEGAVQVVSWPTSSEFSRMENLMECLKLLDYESLFCVPKGFPPLSRTMFIMADKSQAQFPYFASLVSWAMTLAKVDFVDWEFDDPTTASNNILLEISKLGFNIADCQSSKLKLGYSDPALSILEFVVRHALKVLNIQTEKPVYFAAAEGVPMSGGSTDEIDVEEELEVACSDDDSYLNEQVNDDDDDNELMYNELCKTNGEETALSGEGSDKGLRGTSMSVL